MQNYDWYGNVRELKNAIESMVVFSRKEILGVKELSLDVRGVAVEKATEESINIKGVASLDEAEKLVISHALKKAGGNKSKAAEMLGISRRTLHRKLSTHSIGG